MLADDPKTLVDGLVAATLVAASLAVLFVLWQPDVAAALDTKPSSAGNANDKDALRQVRWVLWTRSLPLLATAAATFAILIHQVWPLLCEALGCSWRTCSLHDIKALAVVNAAVVGLLTLGLVGQAVRLWRHYRKLGGLTWLVARKDA